MVSTSAGETSLHPTDSLWKWRTESRALSPSDALPVPEAAHQAGPVLKSFAALERALNEHRHELCRRDPVAKQAVVARAVKASRTRQQLLQQERRQRRLQRYEEVIERYRQGYSQKKISTILHLDRRTVRRWIRDPDRLN